MVLQRDMGKLNNRTFPWSSALLYGAVLLVAPFVSEYLFFLAFAVQVYRMLRYDLRVNCMDLAFSISFSAIYRLPGGISYIVVYILLFNIIFLIKSGKLYIGTGFALFVGAVGYIALRCSGQWDLLYFIFCGLMLLYLLYLSCGQTGHREVLCAFIAGVVISSAFAFVFGENPAIRAIIMQDAEIRDQRFRGLFLDPNYYVTFVILAIVSLMCLNQSKRVHKIVYFGTIAFLIFAGAQTASKSFVLMLVGAFAYYCISLFAQKKFWLGIGLSAGVALLFVLATSGKIQLFQAVIERFEDAEDLSGLTTGRIDIWFDYIAVICSDPFVLLFGKGLDAPLVGGFGTHNVFIETIYNFGIVGFILLVSFFAIVLKKIRIRLKDKGKRLPVRVLPIIAVMAMYAFLQGITSVLFYLGLFIMYECYGCSISNKF